MTKISDITTFTVYRSGDDWIAAVDYALIDDAGNVSLMKSIPVPLTSDMAEQLGEIDAAIKTAEGMEP